MRKRSVWKPVTVHAMKKTPHKATADPHYHLFPLGTEAEWDEIGKKKKEKRSASDTVASNCAQRNRVKSRTCLDLAFRKQKKLVPPSENWNLKMHSNAPGSMRPFFRKPTDEVSYGSLVLEERAESSAAASEPSVSIVYNNPYSSLSIQQQRGRLPIFKYRNHILYLLEKKQTLVLVGETGCGKSTQVPQYLMESGWASDSRLIGITQPRRVAVVTLANRVAEEKMCVLGAEVGYCVRFDDVSSEKTKIKYVTDGILLKEMMVDPLLTKYSILMIDEAHERSINTDLVLGLLRKIISIRKDLRVIISSATLDAELFRDFFELNETTDRENDTATIISVEGRMHPVTVFYTKNSVPNYTTATVDTIIQLHKTEPSGDILAFLPGQDDVDFVCDRLHEITKSLRATKYKLWIVPMYGALPAKEQLKAFDSSVHDTRKAIIATNIAEASVTIPGIAYVIDCGFVKMRALNRENKIECLMTVPISQASAEQRAGRAGRIRPGKCYRLYPQSEFEKMIFGTVPEMQRTMLAPMIIQLKALGIQNVLRFHYLARPSVAAMIQGLELLIALRAVDEDTGLLTNPLGTSMVDLPLPPMHAKTLISSGEFGCSVEIATIIAMMQIQDVFQMVGRNRHQAEVIKRKFAVEEGDHLTLLNVYANFVKNNCSQKWCSRHFLNYRGLNRAKNIREQLIRHMKRLRIPLVSCQGLIGESAKIRRCIVNGFFSQAAFYDHTGKYHTVKENYPFNVYKGSVIMYRKDYPKWAVYTEVMQDSIRDISVIEPEWLYELAPQYYEYGTEGEIARKRKKVDNFDEKDKININ
ncbi:hypothetical protein QR680_012742 [Steinernema hermaphroditum]|uniref:RNA helicase n=1 Tax=Steinernema hermaphroditum TaxID=289476 RepID=A0AA39M1A1_9BILA|nr:hypothetical protein QR680_012742 [Steinernema hermaphroditum]